MEAEIALDYDLVAAAHGRSVLLLIRIESSLSGQKPVIPQGNGQPSGVVARNLIVAMTGRARPVRQVSAYRETQEGGQTAYHLGDLNRAERKTLLVQLSIPPQEKLGEAEIARLRFDFDEAEPAQSVHRTLERTVHVRYAVDAEAQRQIPDSEVVKANLLFEAVGAREDAQRAADRHDFQAAAELLIAAADAIEAANLQDGELQAEYDRLRKEAVDMELGPERDNGPGRKEGADRPSAARRTGTGALGDPSKAALPAVEHDGPPPKVMSWKGSSLKLTMNLLRFGRADDNDMCLPDSEVSRYHCQIVRESGQLYLYDLNSRNGTFANGGRVANRFRLSTGDVIILGSWVFRFE